MTHAIESCVSRKATKLTIDFSLRAAGRLARFLPVAFASPDDAEARRECLLGSLGGGHCPFTNSSVALVHGIVSRLVRELHIPRLRDLLSREALDAQLDAMVREAVASGSPANNPRPASPEEIASLYGEAF